ncbi:uncharacterized protein LOC103701850 isoform X1 [Phoenix dactylifera]|uniref:Uncharacterized protein LOC103701850 isoform X1 n=1 Tax=Phoenix dactylifera TaxID=42345 RepID=A0A8B8J1L8_PHODC|nr:uncharacterized protein LOC103701850 isoform X1 [Phoenix dactylifera]
MFRNKILVRVAPHDPLSSSPFLLLPLSISLPSSPPSPSLSVELETLCWKLSRRWHLACLPQSSEIFIVYQRAQSESVAQVVKALVEAVPVSSVGVEEEVRSASVIAKAVECGLKSFMLDNGWRCVGDNIFVDSTFACSEERSHLCAIDVQVQSEIDDDFVFLVSPDAFRFSRHEISDFVSSKMLERFDNGKEIVLEDYNICTACTILPSLYEGHAIGISKLLPAGEDFERLEELWSFKHGLALCSNYFVAIQFAYGRHMDKQWFPSAFILRGSGLAPTPQTIRHAKAAQSFESFIKKVGAWNFFNQGLLKVKEVYSLGVGMTLPVWNKATNSFPLCITRDKSSPHNEDSFNETYFFSKDLVLALDFRTPKPAFGYNFGGRKFDSTEILVNAVPSSKNNANNSAEGNRHGANANSNIESHSPMKFLPVTKSIHSDLIVDHTQLTSFTKKKIEDIHRDITPRISNDQGLTKEKDMYGESYMKENQLEPADGISMQLDRFSLHSIPFQSAKGSERKEKADAFLDGNCLANPGEVPQKDALGKRTLNSEKKIRENVAVSSKRMRAKQSIDQSDITAKVISHHKRGALHSLSVADLKCFLATKKAKVGGKKDELIQRITALLA